VFGLTSKKPGGEKEKRSAKERRKRGRRFQNDAFWAQWDPACYKMWPQGRGGKLGRIPLEGGRDDSWKKGADSRSHPRLIKKGGRQNPRLSVSTEELADIMLIIRTGLSP